MYDGHMQQASGNGKLASHGNAAQPEVLLLKTDVQTDEPAKRIPRQSYPVPIGAGGRGVSAWARGGDAGRDTESDLPHFHGVANNRGNRESKVDSPALAAARAAAVYDLPALRETGANKRSSHQVRTDSMYPLRFLVLSSTHMYVQHGVGSLSESVGG